MLGMFSIQDQTAVDSLGSLPESVLELEEDLVKDEIEESEDNQLVIIKENVFMPEIPSANVAVSHFETAEKDSENERDSHPKTVKIHESSKIQPITMGSTNIIMESEQEVEVDGDQLVSVLFAFQSQSEVQHFTESVLPPTPVDAVSLPSYEGGSFQQSNLNSLQSSQIKSEITEIKTDCPLYKDVVAFSEDFVGNIVQDADVKANSAEKLATAQSSCGDIRYDSQDSRYAFHINECKFMGWPSIEEFNGALGADKIIEYLSSFKTEEDWFFAVYFNGTTTDRWSSIFHYEVIWSLPTPRYPIVQATATMYFEIEQSLSVPPHCKVKVSYRYEGNNFRFDPETTDFNDFTLNHILDKKIRFFKTVTY